MPTQVNYRDELRKHYKIQKNVSKILTDEECETLWAKLESETDILKFVQSFNKQYSKLKGNNIVYGRQRSKAEQNTSQLEQKYFQLSQLYENLENEVKLGKERKVPLDDKDKDINAEISKLQQSNVALEKQLQDYKTSIKELLKANDVLQKDNKDLKNTVDKIRLEVTRKVKDLMQQDDKELRKAMIRMFKGMLG